MARLSQYERERIQSALVRALTPDNAANINALARAAYDAVFLEYYGAKNLKLFASMPAEWFNHGICSVYVKPTGAKHFRVLNGPDMQVPRTPEKEALSPAAQQAVDAWAAAADAQDKAKKHAEFRVASIMARASTLDALIKLLPAARDILLLPVEEAPDKIAADINTALAARLAPAPHQPTAKPAPSKPAASKPSTRKS